MNTDLFLVLLSLLTVASLLLSFVFVIGIVWRVEMELDLSFKFFSAAVLFLLVTEVLNLMPASRFESWWQFVLPVAKLLTAVSLVLGLFFMRDLIRRLDGEKEATAKSPLEA